MTMHGRWLPALRLALVLAAAGLSLAAKRRPDHMPDIVLKAPNGITALSGQVVDLEGRGLPGVELSVGSSRTRSDAQGRYLLTYVIAGKAVLQIDGRRAGPKGDADHGFHQARVETRAGQTTSLSYKHWLPRIDHARDVAITSPTRGPVVVRTPAIPDLELRIPAGTVIRDVDGRVVTRLSITPIPPDRTPVPLPEHLEIPTFFTIQPGAACLFDARGGVGTATIVYPNWDNELPKARATLWRYEPDANGWTSYGMGTVSADGRQVVPDPGVVITDLGSAECQPSTRTRQPPPERPRLEQRSKPAPSPTPAR